METAIRKNNDQIIKEAREAFKGQWGNVFLAFLLSTLVSVAIGCTSPLTDWRKK